MPWHKNASNGGWPRNAATANHYAGVNALSLWARAQHRGYRSNEWGTYRQWQTLGAYVHKGEKGTPIVFYKKFEALDEVEDRPAKYLIRKSKVFNADQVEGYFPAEPPARNLVEIIESADEFVQATGANIIHFGDRAFYRHTDDRIFMPERERFTGTSTSTPTEGYYATLLHELTHWTGHETRLNRQRSANRDEYAFEELIAELGAAYLCADLKVTNSPRPDHAAYVANWLEIMRGDSTAIFSAAKQASRATEYLKTGSKGAPPEPAAENDIPF